MPCSVVGQILWEALAKKIGDFAAMFNYWRGYFMRIHPSLQGDPKPSRNQLVDCCGHLNCGFNQLSYSWDRSPCSYPIDILVPVGFAVKSREISTRAKPGKCRAFLELFGHLGFPSAGPGRYRMGKAMNTNKASYWMCIFSARSFLGSESESNFSWETGWWWGLEKYVLLLPD